MAKVCTCKSENDLLHLHFTFGDISFDGINIMLAQIALVKCTTLGTIWYNTLFYGTKLLQRKHQKAIVRRIIFINLIAIGRAIQLLYRITRNFQAWIVLNRDFKPAQKYNFNLPPFLCHSRLLMHIQHIYFTTNERK